jgi:hypothetical protein
MKFKFLILTSVILLGGLCGCSDSVKENTKTISEKGTINYKEEKMYFKLNRDDDNVVINLIVSNSAKLYSYEDTNLGLAYDASNKASLTDGLEVYGYMDFELKGTEMSSFNFKVSAIKFIK